MFGITHLKSEFHMTSAEVECPVIGCDTIVARRKKGDPSLRSQQFFCDKCKIFISSSTFEYETENSNLLWKDSEDLRLWNQLKTFKAETNRISRERSEDAVSWNVFRYFERADRTSELVHHVGSVECQTAETIYWSYSPNENRPWTPLLDARVEFGEALNQSNAAFGKGVSEPDIILLTDRHLIFVEAKFGSGNTTSGKPNEVERRVKNPKSYTTGGDNLFETVFTSSYETVVRDQKYELLRFWLMGSWIAQNLGKSFILANLVRERSEQDIEKKFGQHVRQTDERKFARWTWESFVPLLNLTGDADSEILRNYLECKTIGFKADKSRNVASPITAFAAKPPKTLP